MIATVNWEYRILKAPSNGVYRARRRSDGPPIVFNFGSDTVDNDSWSQLAPAEISLGSPTPNYQFAFWSIKGRNEITSQEMAQIVRGRRSDLTLSGSGSWVITAKAFYVPIFGGGTEGGGGGAVLIDAFDIQVGDFFIDDFVDVVPDDSSRTLTSDANDGYINTSKITKLTISARDKVPTNSPTKQFAYWQKIVPPDEDTNGRDIVVTKNELLIAFAFYNQLEPKPFKWPYIPGSYNPWWSIETNGGLTPPRGGDPWLVQLSTAMSLIATAKTIAPDLRKPVLEIAVKQIEQISTLMKNEIKGFKK
jgi:hypothetical protein